MCDEIALFFIGVKGGWISCGQRPGLKKSPPPNFPGVKKNEFSNYEKNPGQIVDLTPLYPGDVSLLIDIGFYSFAMETSTTSRGPRAPRWLHTSWIENTSFYTR